MGARSVTPDQPTRHLHGHARSLRAFRNPNYRLYFFGLARSVTETPGNGGDVTAVTILTQTAPTPLEQNAAWQEINRQLGVNLKFDLALNNDYPAKLATIAAGGDLPDLMLNNVAGSIKNVPEFVRSQCQDLTPYLSGDHVKDYFRGDWIGLAEKRRRSEEDLAGHHQRTRSLRHGRTGRQRFQPEHVLAPRRDVRRSQQLAARLGQTHEGLRDRRVQGCRRLHARPVCGRRLSSRLRDDDRAPGQHEFHEVAERCR